MPILLSRLRRHRPLVVHSPLCHYYAMFAQFPGLRVVVPSRRSTPRDCSYPRYAGNDLSSFLEIGKFFRSGPVRPHDYEILVRGKPRLVREGRYLNRRFIGGDGPPRIEIVVQNSKTTLSVETRSLRGRSPPLDIDTIAKSPGGRRPVGF